MGCICIAPFYSYQPFNALYNILPIDTLVKSWQRLSCKGATSTSGAMAVHMHTRAAMERPTGTILGPVSCCSIVVFKIGDLLKVSVSPFHALGLELVPPLSLGLDLVSVSWCKLQHWYLV